VGGGQKNVTFLVHLSSCQKGGGLVELLLWESPGWCFEFAKKQRKLSGDVVGGRVVFFVQEKKDPGRWVAVQS